MSPGRRYVCPGALEAVLSDLAAARIPPPRLNVSHPSPAARNAPRTRANGVPCPDAALSRAVRSHSLLIREAREHAAGTLTDAVGTHLGLFSAAGGCGNGAAVRRAERAAVGRGLGAGVGKKARACLYDAIAKSCGSLLPLLPRDGGGRQRRRRRRRRRTAAMRTAMSSEEEDSSDGLRDATEWAAPPPVNPFRTCTGEPVHADPRTGTYSTGRVVTVESLLACLTYHGYVLGRAVEYHYRRHDDDDDGGDDSAFVDDDALVEAYDRIASLAKYYLVYVQGLFPPAVDRPWRNREAPAPPSKDGVGDEAAGDGARSPLEKDFALLRSALRRATSSQWCLEDAVGNRVIGAEKWWDAHRECLRALAATGDRVRRRHAPSGHDADADGSEDGGADGGVAIPPPPPPDAVVRDGGASAAAIGPPPPPDVRPAAQVSTLHYTAGARRHRRRRPRRKIGGDDDPLVRELRGRMRELGVGDASSSTSSSFDDDDYGPDRPDADRHYAVGGGEDAGLLNELSSRLGVGRREESETVVF